MARYHPPGYKTVRRKVAPVAAVRPAVPMETQAILQKQKDLQTAVKLQASGQARTVMIKQAAEAEEAAKKEAKLDKRRVAAAAKKAAKAKLTKQAKKATSKKVAKKAVKKVAKKPAAKKPAAKKPAAKKKAVKKIKLIKWDDGETQKVLYQRAKKAGLDVRSKDWKSEIVQAIKKHNKKASK
jgi:hypothetical protein